MDALDQASRRGLLDVLGDRDEGDVPSAEQGPNSHVVLHVPGQPVDLVDDDRVDVAVFGDTGQHRFQCRPVRAAGRLTPVDVLVGQQPAGVTDVTGAGLALGRDREALFPFALLGLLAGRDP
jgi:hypothetical protein